MPYATGEATMSKIDTSTDRIMRLNRLGQADYLHIVLAEERDALREQVESYRKTANDLAMRVAKAEAQRDALAEAIKEVQSIRQDMDDFGGDRRGHMAALDAVEEAAVRLANAALRKEGDK